MSDEVSNDSKQEFIKLSFKTQQVVGTTICLTDVNDDPIMAFVSDRTFTSLLYSSPDLSEATYHVYKGGDISGESINGLYENITSYSNGTKQQYSSNNMIGNSNMPDKEAPGMNDQNPQTPPDLPSGNDQMIQDDSNNETVEGNTEFVLTDSMHIFSNVSDHVETSTSDSSQTTDASQNNDSNNDGSIQNGVDSNDVSSNSSDASDDTKKSSSSKKTSTDTGVNSNLALFSGCLGISAVMILMIIIRIKKA